MTIGRAHLVDPSVTRWYHCVTRCVRRAFLLGEGMHDRKSWIEHRLEELAEIFSVAVAGFAILGVISAVCWRVAYSDQERPWRSYLLLREKVPRRGG